MSRRRQAERKGRIAEICAAGLLLLKGYRILARRFKTPQGEVDLILRKRNALVCVEVKARADLGAALEAVTPGEPQAHRGGGPTVPRDPSGIRQL